MDIKLEIEKIMNIFNPNLQYKIYFKVDSITFQKKYYKMEIYTYYDNINDIITLSDYIISTNIINYLDKIKIHSKIEGILSSRNNIFFLTHGSNLEDIETIAYLKK